MLPWTHITRPNVIAIEMTTFNAQRRAKRYREHLPRRAERKTEALLATPTGAPGHPVNGRYTLMTGNFCIFDRLLDFFLADLFGKLDVSQEPVHYSGITGER